MQQRALIQVAARRLLFLAARTRKGRGAGGKKAARRLWHFYVSVDLMGAEGFLLRFQRIDLHFSSAAGRGSRTRKVLNKYIFTGCKNRCKKCSDCEVALNLPDSLSRVVRAYGNTACCALLLFDVRDFLSQK